MSSLAYYIHFASNTMNPCSLLKDAYAEATRTWLCTGCVAPKPGVTHVDVHIQDDRPEGPLNFVHGGVPLARLSFLLTFGEERIRRDLYLGDVFGPNGNRLQDWATFRGKRGLIVRGSKDASYRICHDCGRNIYFATGTPYLYPAPPIGDVEVFQSDLLGLILPESVVIELEIGKLRGITRERLRVLQEPLDSLPPLAF